MVPPEREILRDRGRALEEEFFRRQNTQLIEKARQAQERDAARATLAKASGISDAGVLDKLLDLGVQPGMAAALSVVPLVEVAWADGSLDDKERQAVLARAREAGFAPGSDEFIQLESWLSHKPPASLLRAWAYLVEGMCGQMTRAEVSAMKAKLLEQARSVAGASGGVLGVRTVSPAESDAIRRLESAFPAGT